jgi:hypothetical protein
MDKSLTDVLFYFVPAILVMGAMFLIVKRFLDRDKQIRLLDMKREMHKDSLPLRLQALERLVLFLERIGPDSILTRVHRSGISAGQFHTELIATIRAEFEHNLSQQIYISDTAWLSVKKAKDEITKLINLALGEVGAHASGVQLSSKVFDLMMKDDNYPHQKAIEVLKNEAKQLIG